MTACAGRIWGCNGAIPLLQPWPAWPPSRGMPTKLRASEHVHLARQRRPLAVPPLRFGAPFLEHWPIRELNQAARRGRDYEPTPATRHGTFTHAGCARARGTAGIVCVGGLRDPGDAGPHADPVTATATIVRRATVACGSTAAGRRAGRDACLRSVAAGAPGNYYHTLIDGMGRLAAVSRRGNWRRRRVCSPRLDPASARWRGCRTRVARALGAAADPRARTGQPAGGAAGAGRACSDSSVQLSPEPGARGSTRRAALAEPGAIGAAYGDSTSTAAPPEARALLNETESGGRRCRRSASCRSTLETPGRAEAADPRFSGMLELIVAPHGAGLANLAFAPAGLPGRSSCRWTRIATGASAAWLG